MGEETERDILNSMRVDIAVIKERMTDYAGLSARVTAMERRIWQAVGAFGTLTLAIPFVYKLLGA